MRCSAGLADAYQGAVIQPGDLPLLDDACRAGPAVGGRRHAATTRVCRDAWRERFGSRTILVVPLLVADEPSARCWPTTWTPPTCSARARVRILSGIASQAAIAIENARLQAQEAERARLGRELELAHDIQRSLLPQEAPAVPGYQIAYRWRSAREVGGDFFDFVPLGPDRLGLVVADVSDKGIPAALYMMFARTLLRAAAFSGREPAAALMRTNELILADSTSDMFVTAYYSVLDIAAHTLTYASAGHNLALYAPADGRAAAADDRPAASRWGSSPRPRSSRRCWPWRPAMSCCFYTDGAPIRSTRPARRSARSAGGRAATRSGRNPPRPSPSAIDAAVRAFAGDVAQYDDFTLILVKRE